jgi:FAD/FMN-containing dehydrogenase
MLAPSPSTTVTFVDAATVRKELANLGCNATVIGPEDGDKYKANITSWNHDVPGKPTVLVQPTTTADVCASVKVVAKLGAKIVIAGGRHGKNCLETNAIVIDMSLMKAVKVNTVEKLVTVEGGCKLGDMDVVCKPYSLACVTGTNPDTGVVGLSVAGGGGYLSRLHGMAVDNFVSAEVVLASGEAVMCFKDTGENTDLLWGLQGAGSNFGIVTKLTMKAHPVDMVYGGVCVNIAPSTKRARTVLNNWQEWITKEAPRSVYSLAVLPCGAPVVPVVVVELDMAVVPQGPKAKCSLKSIPSLKKPFGGFRGAFGSLASIKLLKRRQYHTQMQPLLMAMQEPGHYYEASCVVPDLTPEVIETLVEFTRVKNPNSIAAVLIFPMNACMTDVPAESTSFWGGGRQKDGFWIIIEGKFKPDKKGKNREAAVLWVKDLRNALSKFNVSDTAHTLDGNMESDIAALTAIFGENLPRLREVKAKYDPANFWKCNRNVTLNQKDKCV